MRKIALTGGPASGKSTLLKLAQELGCPVFSADEEVRRLLEPGSPPYEKVKGLCPWAVRQEGTLDRRAILERLSRDKEFRRRLEALLHPLVLKALKDFWKRHQEARVTLAEIPLLFEAGWEGLFDEIWVVACREEVQRERLIKRLGDPVLAEALIKSQWPLSEKVVRAQRVFNSEKPLSELKTELQEALSRI